MSQIGSAIVASDVIASDALYEGTVIIPKGQQALLSIRTEAPKRLLRGGTLSVSAEAVAAFDGTKIQLIRGFATHAEEIRISEPQEALVLLLFLWAKGPNAEIPAGFLMGARVTGPLKFQAKAARAAQGAQPSTSLHPAKAMVFVYQLPRPPVSPGTAVTGSGCCYLKIDSAGAAGVGPGFWACLALEPGRHAVQVNEQELVMDMEAGRSYYVKLTETANSKGEWLLHPLERTVGFELDDQNLEYWGQEKKFKTTCW